MAASKKRKILAVCQTPPPLHGQAVMGQFLVDGKYSGIEIVHVRMGFSDDLESVGKPGWRKCLVLFRLITRILLTRFQTGADILYFPPASPHLPPVVRDVAILLAVRWAFRRVAFHFHAGGLAEYVVSLRWPLGMLARAAYFRPDLAIVLGEFAIPGAAAFRPGRTLAIPNGIPDEEGLVEATEKTPEPPVLLFVGLVCEEKGVGILLEACGLLAARGLTVICRIMGEPRSAEEMEGLRKLAAASGQQVDFCGRQAGAEKRRLFQAADVFCFPSHYTSEALPVVVAEAMMFGLPVVATRWRGIAEMVEDGVSGLLVPVKDPAALADGVEKILRNPDLRARLGAGARRRFEEKYRVEKFWQQMDEALGSL